MEQSTLTEIILIGLGLGLISLIGVMGLMGLLRMTQFKQQLDTLSQDWQRDSSSTLQALQALQGWLQSSQQHNEQAGRTAQTQLDNLSQHMNQQLMGLQKNLSDTLHTQLQSLSEANARRLAEIRQTLENQLKDMQTRSADQLEKMRHTVDEHLQSTLQARLSESFQQVAQRLEQVHAGLGQMQGLAKDVGDLQRVLTNVKARGLFGEVQLEALLEEALTTEQYAKQVSTRPGSQQRVDFAVRLPGRSSKGTPDEDAHVVWLPIDAKFPREDYERLQEAQDRGDAAAVDQAAKALDMRIRQEAKSIADTYLEPPYTTDFAVLFVPVEGLYAQILRRPGLLEALQKLRIVLAGPTTLLALLNSLQMGFRTLALEKQASQVWKILGAVKTEFERYGQWVEKTRDYLRKATDHLDQAGTRTRQIQRTLKVVEPVDTPETQTHAELPLSTAEDEGKGD
jgi:DNA recombination protein RmuC